MELNLDNIQEPLVVNINGQKYNLKRPKIKSVKELKKQLAAPETEESNHFDIVGHYLEQLGLPLSIYEELETWQAEKIVSALSTVDSKKN